MAYKHGAYGVTGSPLADNVVNNETIIVCIVTTTSNNLASGDFDVCLSLADYKTKFGWTGKVLTGTQYAYTYTGDMCAEYLFETCGLNKVVFFTAGQDFTDVDEIVDETTRSTNFLADLYTEKHLIADFVLMPENDTTDSSANADIISAVSNFAGSWNALFLQEMALTGTPTVVSSVVSAKPTPSAKMAAFYGGISEAGDSLGAGVKIPAALIYAGLQAKLDAENNSIPFEIASNKKTENAVSLWPKNWDRVEGNAMNENGINCLIYNEGLRTWGGYLSTYNQTSVQPDEIFISTQRMLEYIKRQFIKKNA